MLLWCSFFKLVWVSDTNATGSERLNPLAGWHIQEPLILHGFLVLPCMFSFVGMFCMLCIPCRFWQYPLPDLPPKLQPVDAVLVEDVDGRLGHGLRHVLEQVPALLNPQGLCVVVLPAASATKDAVAGRHADVPQQQHHSMPLQDVQTWLQENGLTYVTQQVLHYPVSGSTGSAVGIAHAGVWVQSS
eukprot:GHRR01024106.1.p1 GENE.GHRR01024106.1~~GHRR01024106.1.p1  ORF type:complete len:187 (-),score=46.17 GHRR01024106.1:516-1076(-)